MVELVASPVKGATPEPPGTTPGAGSSETLTPTCPSESVSLEPSSEKPADPSPSDALSYASMWTVALAEESYGLILLTHCLEIQPR